MPAARDRSLKRDGVRWTGEDHRTPLEPSIGQFSLLENCYVTSDGSEIRRIPGWVSVGKPRFAESRTIGTWTEGNPTRMTFGSAHYLTNGDKIEFVGATGASAALVNGVHTVIYVSATAIDIAVDTTAGALTDGVGTAYLDRLRHIHGFKQVLGRVMFVAEEKGRIDQAAATIIMDAVVGDPVQIILDRPHGQDIGDTFTVVIGGAAPNFTPDIRGTHTATSITPYAFTIPVAVTVIPNPGDDATATPETVAFTAKLSTPAVYSWSTKPEPGVTEPYATRWPLSTRANIGAPWDLSDFSVMYRRAALDVSAKRLLIAPPGNACVYSADLGAFDLILIREVTSLGIPKGMLRTTLEAIADVGTNPPAGTYFFAVAYRSSYTDDVGLISEPVSITTIAGTTTIRIHFATPWEVLRECPTSCQALIYWGTSAAALRLIKILNPADWITAGVRKGTVYWQLDYDPTATIVPNIYRDLRVEQMPMGAKAIKTTRGFTLFSGFLGPNGIGDQALLYTRAHSATIGNDKLRMYFTCKMVGGKLPPSYQGTRVFQPPGKPTYVDLKTFGTYFPDPAPPPPDAHLWSTESPDITTVLGYHTRTTLLPQMGLLWASEQGFPGVTPAIYRTIVELIRGQDAEGIGRLGDHFIVATENEIYILAFGRLPVEASPQLVIEQHGCNGSPNAIAEWDGGCVGLGRRGPWAVFRGGGFDHIGDRVEDLMPDFKSDSRGHMRHCITAHDSTRGLIWFGFRADAYNDSYGDAEASITAAGGLDDGIKGKIGCDTFLIWSHDANAWSTWRVPEHLASIFWMEEILCDDGITRLAFIAGTDWDAQMYLMDDAYHDGLTTAQLVTGTLDPTHTGEKTSFKAGTTIGTGAATLVGMDYLVTNSDSSVMRGMGRIVSITSATEVELGNMEGNSTTLTLSTGDKIWIGLIHMRVRTQRWGIPPWQGSSVLSAVQSRFNLNTPSVGSPIGFMAPVLRESYAGGVARPENLPLEVPMNSVPLRGQRAFTERGQSISPEHQLEIRFASLAQPAVKDIIIEEAAGG